ncbi:hypothetical protein GCM10009651_35880 [Microbacterium natoriense]
MHTYDKCGLVWEREVAPDHIQWGWCTKPRGHEGPHGHASEDATEREVGGQSNG